MVAIGIERRSVEALIDQTADQAFTDATLTAVAGLEFDMEAGVSYAIDGVLYGTSDAAAQDFIAGAGANTYTGVWEWITVPVGNVPLPATLYLTADAIPEAAESDISSATDVGVTRFSGVISSAADATFQITAAQGTDAGTTTLRGSSMRVRKVNQ